MLRPSDARSWRDGPPPAAAPRVSPRAAPAPPAAGAGGGPGRSPRVSPGASPALGPAPAPFVPAGPGLAGPAGPGPGPAGPGPAGPAPFVPTYPLLGPGPPPAPPHPTPPHQYPYQFHPAATAAAAAIAWRPPPGPSHPLAPGPGCLGGAAPPPPGAPFFAPPAAPFFAPRPREPSAEPGGRPPGPPAKASQGVIILRRGPAGRPEALLVQKRYTYAFADFIHGRYAWGPPARRGRGGAAAQVAALLAGMTREELLDVSSLSFEQMWFRVWLSRGDPAREFFAKKLEKFTASFLRDDGGAALLRLVRAAVPGGALLWEPPKGRAQSAREVDLICAVREVAEETGVEKAEYRLLPAAKCRVAFESAGTRYSCTYYLALANPRLASGATALPPRSPEVGAIAWHDILSARAIDAACGGPAPLAPLLGTAFRLLRRSRRGRRGRPLPPGLAELA